MLLMHIIMDAVRRGFPSHVLLFMWTFSLEAKRILMRLLQSCTRGCIMGTKRYRPSCWMGDKGEKWEDRGRKNNWCNYVKFSDGLWRMSWKTGWCSWDFCFESWYPMIKFGGNEGVSSALWLLSVTANWFWLMMGNYLDNTFGSISDF